MHTVVLHPSKRFNRFSELGEKSHVRTGHTRFGINETNAKCSVFEWSKNMKYSNCECRRIRYRFVCDLFVFSISKRNKIGKSNIDCGHLRGATISHYWMRMNAITSIRLNKIKSSRSYNRNGDCKCANIKIIFMSLSRQHSPHFPFAWIRVRLCVWVLRWCALSASPIGNCRHIFIYTWAKM